MYLVMNLFNDCTSINHGSKGMKILCTVPQTKYFPSLMNKLIFLKIVQVFKKKKKKKTTVQSLNPTVLTTFMNARMITLTII